jgi:methylmalonyl-CoA/ethylmalonyl-CoA epimerase
LRKQRFIQLFNPVPAIALNNRKICYLFNKDVGLIELVEK